MDDKIVIGIVGMPGAGKTTALNRIKDLGAIATLGNVVRLEATERNLPWTDENLGMIAKELRKEHGEDIVAKRCVEGIRNNLVNVVFVDGLRSNYEVEVFRNYWRFPIVAFIVNKDIRYKRLTERGREDDSLKVEDLIERDNRELIFGLNDVIEASNYKVDNNGTVEDLQKKTRTIIRLIIKDLASSL